MKKNGRKEKLRINVLYFVEMEGFVRILDQELVVEESRVVAAAEEKTKQNHIKKHSNKLCKIS